MMMFSDLSMRCNWMLLWPQQAQSSWASGPLPNAFLGYQPWWNWSYPPAIEDLPSLSFEVHGHTNWKQTNLCLRRPNFESCSAFWFVLHMQQGSWYVPWCVMSHEKGAHVCSPSFSCYSPGSHLRIHDPTAQSLSCWSRWCQSWRADVLTCWPSGKLQ
jgi:hypothetical protein